MDEIESNIIEYVPEINSVFTRAKKEQPQTFEGFLVSLIFGCIKYIFSWKINSKIGYVILFYAGVFLAAVPALLIDLLFLILIGIVYLLYILAVNLIFPVLKKILIWASLIIFVISLIIILLYEFNYIKDLILNLFQNAKI
jgi:hypothetical protein